MVRNILGKLAFIAANVLVMIVLHGNSRQWWPKIPYLSLRDESVGEHTRLLFNTLAIVSLAQALLGRLPREQRIPRAIVLIAIPAALPALIWIGPHLLRLHGRDAERYNLAMVPLLPIAAVILEELLAGRRTSAMGVSTEAAIHEGHEDAHALSAFVHLRVPSWIRYRRTSRSG